MEIRTILDELRLRSAKEVIDARNLYKYELSQGNNAMSREWMLRERIWGDVRDWLDELWVKMVLEEEARKAVAESDEEDW